MASFLQQHLLQCFQLFFAPPITETAGFGEVQRHGAAFGDVVGFVQIGLGGASLVGQQQGWADARKPIVPDHRCCHAPVSTCRLSSHSVRGLRPRFKQRFTGTGDYASLIGQRFRLVCKKLVLTKAMPPLRTDLFRQPIAGGQMSLEMFS